jgi:cathepsin A (carboxypeptidase C)
MMKLLLPIILGVLSMVQADGPAEDLVARLPEMDTSTFAMYSGFIPIPSSSKRLHFLLAESQGDWKTDPLIIWFNGGPGCSSLLAFATENGPYQMSAGQSTFHVNPQSWNLKANVLYIEQPAGVGFSYCNYTANPKDCEFDDMTQSEDTLTFVTAWLERYPSYKDKPLYISGESYGGIYIPYLAWQLAHNSTVKVTGFMVGNGVTNWKYDTTPATI